MNEQEQIQAFVSELQSVIDRFRAEFDLPMATAIGCLEFVKLSLFSETMNGDEDDDD